MPASILKHLSPDDQSDDLGAAFFVLGSELDSRLPDCAEKSAGLRKLLEAQDCFKRASKEGKR